MKKIYISFEDLELGCLFKINNEIMFSADEQAIQKMEENNPIATTFFKLNKQGQQKYQIIPEPFSFFLSNTRKDIIEKANIQEEDDEFEKLFKIAGLNLMPQIFRIYQ